MFHDCDNCKKPTTYDAIFVTSDCDQICEGCWNRILLDSNHEFVGRTFDRNDASWRWYSRGGDVSCVCGQSHHIFVGMQEQDRIACWCGRVFVCLQWDGFSGIGAKRRWQNISFSSERKVSNG